MIIRIIPLASHYSEEWPWFLLLERVMVSRKPKEKLNATGLDALVVAVSPALIMGMVSCLVFFLIAAFYRGQYDQRLIYILGLYIFAAVLIARIAIESGRMHSIAFSIPLAIAAMIAMAKFVTVTGALAPIGWLVNIAMLGLAWYLADRITFDCTLLDERERGVQQGLLQSLGWLHADNTQINPIDPPRPPAKNGESGQDKPRQPKVKKHNPGVWVLYFSLLAFPLFGLGQLAISDPQARNSAFYYLLGYLACGLGLLVSTSFVSMRRYLRHRGVAMPAELSRTWLATGLLGSMLILGLCMLLPLPGRSWAMGDWSLATTSAENQSSSRFGWGNEPGQSDADTQPEGPAQAASSEDPPDKPTTNGSPSDAQNPDSADADSRHPANSQKSAAQGKQNAGKSPSQQVAGDSKSGESKSRDSKSRDSKSGESKSGESKSGESKSGESKSGESKSGESKSGESQSGESQIG